MQKIVIITLILICFQCKAYSQEPDSIITKKNTLFIEMGGKSIWYSFNYDRYFFLIDKFKISASLGYSFLNAKNQAIIPQLALLYGKKNWNTELGFGYTIQKYNNPKSGFPSYSLSLGMRYQPMKGGLFFRAAITPLFGLNLPISVLPWAGLSLGYTF